MTQRYCLLGVLVAVLMSSVAFADYAPIQLDTLGVNLRQGYHTEWYRAGAHDPSTGDKVYTWSDCRGGYRDVYAQKIDVNGNSQWGEGGKLICRNEGRQEDPEVIYSGSGNWIFAWVDYRNTPNVIEAGDVYAQKVDSNGDPLWDPAGVAVCTAEGVQISLRPVSDGAGGLFTINISQSPEIPIAERIERRKQKRADIDTKRNALKNTPHGNLQDRINRMEELLNSIYGGLD